MNTLSNLVLFNKELGRYPYKYRLYFAEASTIKSSKPQIHRFCVSSRSVFYELELGQSYLLHFSGVNINSYTPLEEYTLTDEDYFRLVDMRDLVFMDKASAKRINLLDESYSPEDVYYSYSTYRRLLGYRPPTGQIIGICALKVLLYVLCLLIPLIPYLLYVLSFMGGAGEAYMHSIFTLPIVCIGTLPFVMWIMTAIYTLSEYLLLNLGFSRYYILRSYALRWAGMRKSCYIERSQRDRLVLYGFISMGILGVSMLLVYAIL